MVVLLSENDDENLKAGNDQSATARFGTRSKEIRNRSSILRCGLVVANKERFWYTLMALAKRPRCYACSEWK